MNDPTDSPARAGHRPPRPCLVLRLYPGSEANPQPPRRITRWIINGFPAVVEIWTSLQWHKLGARERPADVQVLGDGTRVSMKME